ncbi:MAG: hypothetical protein CL624_10405 [Arcobacter sp.]|nr:hypothetical protein [Arcobacter sp.]|tara:strand:+ start:4507 stop:7299 length:2793 start_codon:yes stop_codon:yes gene_type:complete
MKFFLFLLLFINISFANSENISRMNSLKKVIQKEEYISLAINKYILQTGSIPKTSSNKLDWTKLEVEDYLGSSFNKNNPLTSKDINVYYDTSSYNFFIRGVLDDLEDPKFLYDTDLVYLYNFYASRIFRVNTLAPINVTEEKLRKGSQVIYSSIQKEIVKTLNLSSNNTIKLDSEECTVSTYFYELKGEELTYKYCKESDNPITVYQDSPIYVEDSDELQYIKAKIGDKAYAKKNGTWYEYYYQGDTSTPWVPEYLGSTLTTTDENENVEDLILSYIPDSKDLVFRQDGGCMLANGDIFCWGNNKYKKAGIENYGQIDTSLSPDYVNTPVMLKVQIDDISTINGLTRNDKNWYNNPYRVKFEKMAMNSSNVCGISPIFEYSSLGVAKKIGGELYCNGSVSSTYFEDLDDDTKKTSILKKSKFFTVGKDDFLNDNDEIYLEDIVMVEDTVIVLSDAGDIYTFGRNYKGALGIDSTDKFISTSEPVKIDNDGTIFKKIFALRDIKSIGAIDEDNNFWIWGERSNGTIYYKPTLLNTSRKFNEDAIFVNTDEFILKGVDNVFYKTTGDNSIEALRDSSGDLIPSTAASVSVYGDFYIYINEDLELKGSDTLLKCMRPNETTECTNNTNKELFDAALTELNTKSNSVNGKTFANFANVSIFKLDNVITEEFEDFETEAVGWSNNTRTEVSDDGTNQVPVTNFLGRFQIGTSVNKTFSFPSYANNEVEIEFDFYEIDTWDYERFTVKLNDEVFVEDNFIHDNHPDLTDVKDTGESLQAVASSGGHNDGDQKFHYKLRTNLDSSGDIKVEFSTRGLVNGDFGKNQWSFAQSLNDESWGIDNVHIKVKETNKKFVCAMTGFESKSQMYCWGNTARSIPVLSTSLYDMSKISSINKLFITQEEDKKTQMTYNHYNSGGKLFLRYPTYIGGFDYGFYFK